MAGLCGGGNEPPGSLKANKKLNISKMDAFTSFMTNPVNTFEYDKCKLALKEKYKEAKDIAESIKKSQDVFKTSQETLQQTRNDEENRILKISQQNIDQEHTCYEKNLHRLRELKSETYHVKDELQKAKSRLLTKFQEWWKIQTHNGPTNSGADIIPSLHLDDVDELSGNKSSQYLCHSAKWEEEKPIKLNKYITSDTDRYQETQNKYMIDDSNKCATNSSTCLQKKIGCNVLLKNSVTEPMTYNGCISKTSVPNELVTSTTSQEFKCHSESGPDHTNDTSSVDSYILKSNYSRSINSVNHAFSSKENNTMNNEKSEPSLYKSSNKWDNRPTYIKESDDTQPLSDERDSSVMKNLPLTGDPEIDDEIIAFYQARSKVVHG
ncbi:hypothetical protein ANN_27314 [Periplaneta americana]|uniref:Kinesin-like protein KIF6/9 C-terminal domain-containing protein n=1 Tax=Periplaneta americana TaxID=6978 RepID=A0ABQ8RXZ2_PERAM|nr:hypothetical protein ANN_27314 [Periplaneta americana]